MNVQSSGQKRQLRSVQTENQLLVAAEDLFAKKGYVETKLSDIIERAGASTGSFYHYFKDKDALAKVMIGRFIEEGSARIAEFDARIATHGNLRVFLTSLAWVICDIMDQRLGAYRAARHLAALDAQKGADPVVLVAPLQAKVLLHLDEYRSQIDAPDPSAALSLSLQMMITILLQTRLGAGPLFPKDRDQLIKVLVTAAMGLLQENRLK